MSGSLFVLAVALLANTLRKNKDTKDITVNDKIILLSQYADDTTIFIEDIQSAKVALQLIETFGEVSSLKLNKCKCEGLWLGRQKHCKTQLFDILWPAKPIKALGVHFSHSAEIKVKLNFHDKLESMQKTLNSWKGRNLTPIGKICILKMFGISKLIYLCSNLNVPSAFQKKQVNTKIADFVWNSPVSKVKRTTMIQTTKAGGLNMPEMGLMCKALKIMWVKRLLNEEQRQWKIIPLYYLEKVGTRLIFECNYDVKLLNIDLPPVYNNILLAWSELIQTTPKTSEEVSREILWNNRFITINNRSVWWKSWYDQGLIRVKDLLRENGTICSYDEIKELNDIDSWSYVSLVDAIPSKWKTVLKIASLNKSHKSIESDNVKGQSHLKLPDAH